MNLEAIKQFLVGVVIPPIAGALATWLAGTKVFAILNLTHAAAAAAIIQGLTFLVVTAIAALVNHHILSGHYNPQSKATPKA